MLRGRYKLTSLPESLLTGVTSALSTVGQYLPPGLARGVPIAGDLKNIHELLDAEAEFAKQTQGQLDPFAPHLLQAFDTAIGMYTTFGRIIGQHPPTPGIDRQIAEYASKLGVDGRDELEAVRAVRPGSTPENEILLQHIQVLHDRAEAWMIRGVVFIQVARAFAWSVGDLMRSRMSTATGLQRLVAEGFGLLCLMRDDPSVAIAWKGVVTDEDGVAFYKAHQRRLLAELEKAGLLATYERASGVSVHLRFAGATLGLAFQEHEEGSRRFSSTVMLHQELRPDTAFNFINGAVAILDAEAAVFTGLTSAFPEADEPTWTDSRVPRFVDMVRALWGRFRTAFPAEIAHLERRFGPLKALGPPATTR